MSNLLSFLVLLHSTNGLPPDAIVLPQRSIIVLVETNWVKIFGDRHSESGTNLDHEWGIVVTNVYAVKTMAITVSNLVEQTTSWPLGIGIRDTNAPDRWVPVPHPPTPGVRQSYEYAH